MDIPYVHVKWTQTGADDMVPARAAHALASVGDLTIVDATPRRYRLFKPRLPLGRRTTATRRAAANPRPEGAPTAEEATE